MLLEIYMPSATPETRTVIKITEGPVKGCTTMRSIMDGPHAELVGKAAIITTTQAFRDLPGDMHPL